MTVFADSSALVKLYVGEAHHQAIRQITEPIVISALAEVEVPGALWRKYRMGEIGAEDAAVLSAEFAADVVGDDLPMPRFAVVSVDPDVVSTAQAMIARHPLRAYDAVQLASALLVARALDGLNGFVAFDRALRAAAAAEGLVPLPEIVVG